MHPLPPDDSHIHLFFASLDRSDADVERFGTLLSPEEKRRAGLFRFARDRRRFTAARAILRTLLGQYLGLDPARVEFRYTNTGKPSLAAGQAAGGLTFNLSHSKDGGLFGFSRGREIGVDLERRRAMPDAAELVEAYFAPGEKSYFRAQPAERRDEVFFSLWTRKEAYLKACGDGLLRPLDDLEILEAESAGWTVRGVDVGGIFSAAYAVKAPGTCAEVYYWEPRPGETAASPI
jgi:4'-phosphopantetheinyl transferase